VLINQLFRFFFYLFCFTIPLNQFLNVRILVATLIISFFTNTRQSYDHLKKSWDIILYMLVLIGGLAYSDDLTLGFRIIETSFSFLALPIIMNKMQFDGFSVDKSFRIFCYGLVITCSICLVNASIQFTRNDDFKFFFFYELTDIINFHPTYFAYYIIFAITYWLYLVYYNNKSFDKVWVLFIFFLYIMLLLTGGKTTFVCLLLVFSFFILKFLVEQRTRQMTYAVVLILSMLCCLFIVNYFEGDIRNSALNDSWERLVLWESAFKAVPNIFFGVGTGDYRSELNTYYFTHQLAKYATENLNSHNQVIQLLFSNGVLGVLSFIFLLARPLYLAVKFQNMLAVLVLFPFVIYGITEVFLGRYQGVVFFVWLHEIFIVSLRAEKLNVIEQLPVNDSR